MRRLISIMALVFCAAALQAAQVGLVKIDGPIGPATVSYVSRALDVAAVKNPAIRTRGNRVPDGPPGLSFLVQLSLRQRGLELRDFSGLARLAVEG